MSTLIHRIATYEKHRKVQLFVTGGTMVGALVALAFPQFTHVSVFAGVATNLIWVWE